jgi:hypothetical protein
MGCPSLISPVVLIKKSPYTYRQIANNQEKFGAKRVGLVDSCLSTLRFGRRAISAK